MDDIEKQLQRAIIESGLSYYRIAADCEMDNHSLKRFAQGKQTITMTLAARVARRLGLELGKGKDDGQHNQRPQRS